MTSERYDVIIIGAGPGGYVCAIRCAQLGMRTACVDKRGSPGGTCLNVGCIPSKALLHASEKYAQAASHLGAFGVKTGKVSLDLGTMMAHKDGVVESNTKGIDYLFKKNGIDRIEGEASLAGDGAVRVGDQTFAAENIIIATGSEPVSLPGVEIDEQRILSSTGALALDKVPQSMAVIGGGYIGLEMASVWSRLGARVTVIEFLDRILPGMDGEISGAMQALLEKQGIDFRLQTKVAGAKTSARRVELALKPADSGEGSGEHERMKVETLLVAVGRKPCTAGLGLENVGIELDERGRIKTDHRFRTNVPGVHAIGDVIAGPMLAHKAEEEGVLLAEMLAGEWGEAGTHIDYALVPGVVYTSPEAAQIGQTEEQLKSGNIPYNVGKFPFSANGRARAMGMTEGFVKVLADVRSDRILGVHIIGPEAGTLIAEAAAIMEFGGTSEDMARICHAHPTLEEALKEAALAVHGRPVHM